LTIHIIKFVVINSLPQFRKASQLKRSHTCFSIISVLFEGGNHNQNCPSVTPLNKTVIQCSPLDACEVTSLPWPSTSLSDANSATRVGSQLQHTVSPQLAHQKLAGKNDLLCKCHVVIWHSAQLTSSPCGASLQCFQFQKTSGFIVSQTEERS